MTTPRMDQILKEADERLELFYSYYGDSDGCKKVKKGEKKKCQVLYCNKFVPTGSSSKCCTFHQKKNEGVSSKTFPSLEKGSSTIPRISQIINSIPKKITKEVDLRGLNAREIISKTYGIIGIQITVSPKSKNSVIRHAQALFIEKGYKVLCDEIKSTPKEKKVLVKKEPEIIKRVCVEGEKHRVPCPKCEKITQGTLLSAEYQFKGRTFPGVLQLFCDDCGSYAGIPHQSSIKVATLYKGNPESLKVQLTGLSAKEIVAKVEKILNEKILINIKSKKPIIKYASKLFEDKGYKVII